MVRVLSVAGARPNFVKVAALWRAFAAHPALDPGLVHTGQHYDRRLSGVFFEQLGLPEPDHHLGVGSGTHGEQTAGVLVGMERVLAADRPGVVVVVGDVNSTLAAALAATKAHVPVAHVEAGLRSGDRAMPEEVNRLATDAICDVLYASEEAGRDALRAEGHPAERVVFVGNVMIDTLDRQRAAAAATGAAAARGLEPGGYVLVTMHRPATVDDPDRLADLVGVVERAAAAYPVVWPLHPRTRARLDAVGLADRLAATPDIRPGEPVGYLEFLDLQANAAAVVTDSGGIQEETTVLGVPCLTLRPSTERPATVRYGTNRLVALDADAVGAALAEVAAGRWPTGRRPPLWDGRAAERVADDLARRFG